ncbi:glycosyltransferase family 4 protein [Mycolicibacterium sp. PAM1]|uniref:glycosyltransferase family 4 protein n=1 Tax=Mycolicibacterium sp. PAM1 TaxID=2853535 RepID=UPI001C3CF0D7|nr:glycosyltransferase family 4 protein [Mycolicibacterium sp. PAM1]MBV5245386.1 glycosyltransferase family 4 protein [Mycolicibacterium sp. PAM1]
MEERLAESAESQERLRVCFFIPEFDYGGAQKQCILLLNELQRRDDVELMLVRFRSGPQDHLLRTDRLRTEYVGIRSNFDPRAITAVRRLAMDFQADVIMSWIRVADVYSYFVRLLNPEVKWVMTQRNSTPAASWLRRVRDGLGTRADAIAANSPGGVQWWKSKRARGSVYLVDNIADSRRSTPTQRSARSLLYVGRLEPQKNVLTMVRAFVAIVRQQPEVKIYICGDGTLRAEMETITAEAGVGGRIEFLGFRADATEWMTRCEVLVSLSDYEGMPNVLMEGVQAGCRIVASSIDEHVELLGPKYPFLVRDHHDADAVVAVLSQALASPANSDDLAHAQQRLARMEPAAVAARYMDIFRAAVRGNPTTAPSD